MNLLCDIFIWSLPGNGPLFEELGQENFTVFKRIKVKVTHIKNKNAPDSRGLSPR